MPTRLVVAMTTCSNFEQAERLGRLLVEKRLVACVSIGQELRSMYPWNGQIQMDSEVPLTLKTAPERLANLKQAIEDHHPYEVPEFLVLAVEDGSKPYVDWAREWVQAEARKDVE